MGGGLRPPPPQLCGPGPSELHRHLCRTVSSDFPKPRGKAAITNDHKVGVLKQQKFVLSQSGGQKSEIRLLAGLLPSEPLRENPFQILLQKGGAGVWVLF